MDWLSESLGHVLRDEWELFPQVARSGARMLWRSASLRANFVDSVEINLRGERCRVGEILKYNTKLAKKLQATDRVHTYGSFAIADLMT